MKLLVIASITILNDFSTVSEYFFAI